MSGFKVGDRVVLTRGPYRGRLATVRDIAPSASRESWRVNYATVDLSDGGPIGLGVPDSCLRHENALDIAPSRVIPLSVETTSHLDPWLTTMLEEVEVLMRERGAKYGPGNIAEFGDYGVLVRLSDKLARLRHAHDKDFADERIEDAWLDIIGYGLIGLAWVRGNWPRSRNGDS